MERERLRFKDMLMVLLLGCINVYIFTENGNVFFESISSKSYLGFGFYMTSILLASLYLNPWLIFTSCLGHIVIILIYNLSGFLGLFLFLVIVFIQFISKKILKRKANVVYGVTYFVKREIDSKQFKASKYDFYVTILILLGFVILTRLDEYGASVRY